MREDFLTNTPLADRDDKNGVSLYCGKRNTSPQHCGVVVVNEKQLFPTFPYAIDTSLIDISDRHTAPDVYLTYAFEGTLIRVFCVNTTWYTSSNKRLDIFQSSWADKTTSFGETFAAAIRNEMGLDHTVDDKGSLVDFYTAYLKPEHVYFFMLRTTERERIVCHAPDTATAYHVATVIDGKICFKHRIELPNNEQFTHPQRLNVFGPLQLRELVVKLDHFHYQGVLCVRGGVHYKFFNPVYARLVKIRGNMPSLRARYIALRKHHLEVDREEFLNLYPQFAATTEEFEDSVFKLCCALHRYYMDIYINRVYRRVHEDIFGVIRLIHLRHIQTRLPTSVSRINDILTDEKPSVFNTILRKLPRLI